MISAILLAAGSSRRMGNVNKLLLPYQGGTILSLTAEHILAAGIEDLVIVTGHEATAVELEIGHLPVRIVHNPRHEDGMTGSIQTGINLAKGEGFMICLADMVLITPEEYSLLRKNFESRWSHNDRCIIQPVYDNKKGNPVIFSAYYRDSILRHPEKEGCKEIIRSHADQLYTVEMPTDHVLRDIDYPDEYKAL